MKKNPFPSHLSDRALLCELIRLARCEREATVHLMTHLAELDRRRLYRQAGYSSLFVYCTKVLQLSEHEAFNRMKAARAVRRFPQILDLLAKGSLNLTTLKLIGRHLTQENHGELLEAACGKTKRQVEELVARLFPQPDVPATVRALPAPTVRSMAAPVAADACAAPLTLVLTDEQPSSGSSTTRAEPPASPQMLSGASPVPPAPYRPPVTPLAPQRYQITFTASADTREKLEFAQDLLRHAIPNGDVAAIMDRALTALIEVLVRKKFAVTGSPRQSNGTAKGSPHIPAAVKRIVYIRDRGRCTFVGANGRRCNERGFIQYGHIQSRATGGPATVDNIRLLCKSHNLHEADVEFGSRRGDEGIVRETKASYDLSNVRSTRSGTTCAFEAQPSAWRIASMGFESMRWLSCTQAARDV